MAETTSQGTWRSLYWLGGSAALIAATLALSDTVISMVSGVPLPDPNTGNIYDWLDPVKALVRPVNTGLFAGFLDISKVPSLSDRLKFRMSVLFGVWKEGDHRDWVAIRAWAEETRRLLLK